jgi:ParB-like chromosome segregation protein Spo0J
MTSWRDVLKIHPAAELFPMMSPEELKTLAEDIKANGLRHPVVFQSGVTDVLLDGRNRLDAMESVGMAILNEDGRCIDPLGWDETDVDPYTYVISANIHRRHLTPAQKGDLTEKLLKTKPERSDRETARIAKVDHKTVGARRAKLEATGEIPQLPARTGADGKARKPSSKTQRRRKQAIAREPDPGVKIAAPTEPPQNEASPPPATVADPSASQPQSPAPPPASPPPREQFEAERDAKVAGIVLQIQRLASSERLLLWNRCAELWHKEMRVDIAAVEGAPSP